MPRAESFPSRGLCHPSCRVRPPVLWFAVGLPLWAVFLFAAGGCAAAGFVAEAVARGPKQVNIKAAYTGLESRRVAVLVTVTEATLFEYPEAPVKVGRAVSARIAANVPGSHLVTPVQIAAFQKANPHWDSVPGSALIERLGVDRLVMIDLSEYSTHEPGNAHVFRGVVVGNVDVLEGDGLDPNNAVFSHYVAIRFPEGMAVSVVAEDAPTIELGMLDQFSRAVSGRFHDHTVIRE